MVNSIRLSACLECLIVCCTVYGNLEEAPWNVRQSYIRTQFRAISAVHGLYHPMISAIHEGIVQLSFGVIEMKVGSQQTINFIETGRYMPSTIVALKIAKYFGRHADEIFQLEEND